MKVYLAGGMKSGWQDIVRNQFEWSVIWLDPRKHMQTEPRYFTVVDLAGIKACDVVFVFMERSNPAGQNLAFELGYAMALNKTIVLVINHEHPYFGMAEVSADAVFDNLEDGIEYLKDLVLMVDG